MFYLSQITSKFFLAKLLVFFLLFILPFAIAPLGITQFEDPKVILAELGIIMLFLVAFFGNMRILPFKTSHRLLYSAIVMVTILDLLFFRTQFSFFGNAFRMQGIVLLWFLLLFSLLSAQSSLKQIPWFLYGVVLLAEFVSLFFLPLNESHRAVGTLGEPNALAAFAIFVWPFSFYAIKKRGVTENVGLFIILLLVLAMLFFSNSRSGMIAFAIQLLFIGLTKLRLSLKKIVGLCIGVYILSYILPFFDQVPYENRIEVWQSALVVGMSAPVIGHGFGNAGNALHTAARHLGLPIQYYYVDSAHNIFLDWWVQGGGVGVLILLMLLYLTLRTFMKKDNRRELVLLLSMVTVLSFNPASIVGLLGFWWLIGQGMRKEEIRAKKE